MTDETGDDREPIPDRPRSALPLLGLVAALGLVVAALCLHGTGGAPLYDAGPMSGYWTGFALLAAVAGGVCAAKYRAGQQERPRMTVREERITAAVFAGILTLMAGTVIGLFISGDGATNRPPPQPIVTTSPRPIPTPPPNTVSATAAPVRTVPKGGFDLLQLLEIGVLVLLAVLTVAVVVVVVRWLRRRARTAFVVAPAPDPKQDEERLADAISAGRLALQGEDTRAAVIACYAAMEASLAANGLGRNAADSPSDLLGRASAAGLLEGPAPDALAELFREARFSHHPMGPTQLDRARAALEEISAHLARSRARAEAEADAWAAEGEPVRPDEQEAVAP